MQPRNRYKHNPTHYTKNGNLLITITKTRLEWLWKQYNINSNIQHHIEPPRQSFEIEIIWLCERYKYCIPNIDSLKKSQYTLPLDILNQIITTFKITTSYFSSPFTRPTKISNFYSPFQRDSIIGSHGLAYAHKWQNIEYTHPYNT